jgi:hypothetical protein
MKRTSARSFRPIADSAGAPMSARNSLARFCPANVRNARDGIVWISTAASADRVFPGPLGRATVVTSPLSREYGADFVAVVHEFAATAINSVARPARRGRDPRSAFSHSVSRAERAGLKPRP